MNRALVIKELRECAPLVAIAALLATWALWVYTGGQIWPGAGHSTERVPFVGDDFHFGPVLTIVGGLAVLLGLKQTAWEDVRGAYHYLLHRPVDRGRVFLVKAAVGLALVQTLAGLMILIYALWAATPGTHASPFEWSMTVPTWKLWTTLSLLYLGAALSGLRPASWYASRLMPLAACGVLAFVVGCLPWAWMTAVGVAIIGALLLACILFTARTRDF